MNATFPRDNDKVTGKYFGVEFSGVVTSTRAHTMNHRKQIFFVKLDAPTDVMGMKRNDICITVNFDGLCDESVSCEIRKV